MMHTTLVASWIFVFAVCVTPCYGYPSPQPVIGILIETVYTYYLSCHGPYKVLTAYQSFVEQGGGGAVPIFVNQSDEYYEKLIPRLNGVLLTGGGVSVITSGYGKAAYKIFNMAKKMNDEGTHFPIWGTCLGMEEMTTWPFSPRQNPLHSCADTEDVMLPLNFTAEASSSKLYGSLPDFLRDILCKESVTPNFHHSCLTTKTYASYKELTDFYAVLSTNVDGKGMKFVSTMEARNYPFYGVQFHPEKMNYIHTPKFRVNQSLHAVVAGQYFGNFLIQEAKRNNNSFKSYSEESRFLINRYPTMFDEFYQFYCLSDSDVPNFDQ